MALKEADFAISDNVIGDLMDGSVYKLPDTMRVEGDYPFQSGDSTVWDVPRGKNAYTYSNLPIKDYPMALIFGDIRKFI